MSATLAIVGGGRMGEALATGLLRGGWAAADDLLVVEEQPGRVEELRARHSSLRVSSSMEPADGAVVAVKPGDVRRACQAIAEAGTTRVLSVAAGVRLASLEAWLGDGVAVVRAMPNTPALIGAGAAAIAAGSAAGDDELAWAETILGAVGIVVRVSEPLLDAVTGLSGSGPAYVFLIAEGLVEAGVLNGLSYEVSRTLATQTLLGAARLLAESGQEAPALRAAVTSPGGTTAAGIRALEARAVRGALLEAVTAATERSRQLGDA
jgi:pyrroline-5-carboxylate reductase